MEISQSAGRGERADRFRSRWPRMPRSACAGEPRVTTGGGTARSAGRWPH